MMVILSAPYHPFCALIYAYGTALLLSLVGHEQRRRNRCDANLKPLKA